MSHKPAYHNTKKDWYLTGNHMHWYPRGEDPGENKTRIIMTKPKFSANPGSNINLNTQRHWKNRCLLCSSKPKIKYQASASDLILKLTITSTPQILQSHHTVQRVPSPITGPRV